MMEHTWYRATRSIRHLLQPWKYCNTKVIDNDVDLNEIKETVHLDFGIKMERSFLCLIKFYEMILIIFPSMKSSVTG